MKFIVRNTHKYLSFFISIQLLLWTVSGIYFAFNKIENVRGEQYRLNQPADILLGELSFSIPDAIDINIFYKKCSTDNKCVVQKNNESIEAELRKEILKKATLYQRQSKEKNKSFYPTPKIGGEAE